MTTDRATPVTAEQVTRAVTWAEVVKREFSGRGSDVEILGHFNALIAAVAERDDLLGKHRLALAMIERAGYHNDKLNECKVERDAALLALTELVACEDLSIQLSYELNATPFPDAEHPKKMSGEWHVLARERLLREVAAWAAARAILAAQPKDDQ